MATHPPQARARSAGDAVQLATVQRPIAGDDDNDRAGVHLRRRIRQQLAQRRANAHAAQRQRVEGTEVGQHQHAEHGA